MQGDSRTLAEHGVIWDEDGTPRGFQIGKAAALLDSAHRREEREFRKLCEKLQKAKWQREHREQCNAWTRECKARRRAKDPAYRTIEAERCRAARKRESDKRRAATVYTCGHCGSQWSPACGQLPRNPPKWCSIKCRNARKLAERRAAGICFECGGPAGGKVRCAACTEKQRVRKLRARQKARAA